MKYSSVVSKFIMLYNDCYLRLQLYRHKVICDEKIKVNGRIKIINNGEILIGKKFKANSGENMNPIGGDTVLRLICKSGATLIIGNKVGISNSTIFCTTKITIGDNVMIGGGCKIWDSDFHSLNSSIRGTDRDRLYAVKSEVVIESNVFIGASSIILKGVKIGENSIIGAGSVVSRSIPNGEIWAGNPAKFIKRLND